MVNITAINFKLTKGISNHVDKRMEKFLKFVQDDKNMNVVLESNKYGKKAEVSFILHNKPLRASALNDDLYVAIDLLTDKLDSVIRKNSGKLNEFNKNESIKHIQYYNKNKITEKEDNTPKIVRRKTVSSKPMFEEEAIEQMELLDHRSFIFYNASTEKVSMLYKRLDGNYGILEVD